MINHDKVLTALTNFLDSHGIGYGHMDVVAVPGSCHYIMLKAIITLDKFKSLIRSDPKTLGLLVFSGTLIEEHLRTLTELRTTAPELKHLPEDPAFSCTLFTIPIIEQGYVNVGVK